MSWDDRQTNIKWNKIKSYLLDSETSEQTIVKKVIEPMDEPNYEIVAGFFRCIVVLFSATATFSEYECKLEHIQFKDTLIFQVIQNIVINKLTYSISKCILSKPESVNDH